MPDDPHPLKTVINGLLAIPALILFSAIFVFVLAIVFRIIIAAFGG